jgi:hypothetical protein
MSALPPAGPTSIPDRQDSVPAPIANVTVTGVVFGDGTPLPDVTVEVRNRHVMERTMTDASGRYRASVHGADSPTVWVTAYHHDRFRFQPCGAWVEQTESAQVERTVDVQLSSAEALSGGVPVSTAGRRRISGTIYALTPDGRQPMSDVIVAWDLSDDDHKAWTQTDSAGRFTLCGLPVDGRVHLVAFQGNQYAWMDVEAGGDTSVELTLEALGP